MRSRYDKGNNMYNQLQIKANLKWEKSTLILVPTPIDDLSPLEPVAFSYLQKACTPEEIGHCLFVVEEVRNSRRRWLNWGLPKEAIDHFRPCNEHNFQESSQDILLDLQK